MVKYHNDTFDNIPDKKREKILQVALSEFSKNGLAGTKVGDIAKKAGISHGSMYTYFPTKDALINTIMQTGFENQREAFSQIVFEGNVFQKLESVLNYSFNISSSEPEKIAIWNEMSFEFNSKFSKNVIAMEMEAIVFWQKFIEDGKTEGIIDKNIDTNSTAFCIDSIIGTFMRSFISRHEKTKLQGHFGQKTESGEEMVKDIMGVLKKMLTP